MQQLFPPGLGDIMNCYLSNAIMKVGVDATMGELLLLLIAMCNEGVVSKASIVCIIVFDGNMVVCCKWFECQFYLDGLSLDTFVIMCMYQSPEKWLTKMVAAL